MTLALYCSLGACHKCGGKRCACTCHGGRTPPPAPAPPARDAELHCRHCNERAVDNSGLANHERSCPKQPDAPAEELAVPEHKCRFCANTSPNAQGRAAHERWCKQNPDRRTTATPRRTTTTTPDLAPVVADPPPAADIAIAVEGELTVTIKGPAGRILELLRAIDR